MAIQKFDNDRQFDEIIHIIEESRKNALRKVNEELIMMYWRVGEYISRQSKNASYGDSYIQSLADFFSMMTEIGANLFDLDWVKAALHFFNLFGWGLFIAGLVVAIFDTAIEYQTMGRLNIKKQVLPFLYGLLAVNLKVR